MTSLAPAGFDPADIEPPPLRERPRPIVALALDVAGRCNLACRYCAESATQPRHRPGMSEAVLEQALSLLQPTLPLDLAPSIRLGSGEPLLAAPLLRRLDDQLKARRDAGLPVPEVFITTNGTLLHADTLDWLVATGWNVKISLDGPASVHDRWRVTARGRGTHAQVAEAARELARRIPRRFAVSAVLCRGNDPAEVFAAIAELGVRRIELVPVAHEDPAIIPDAADLTRYGQIVDDYATRFADAEPGLPELVRVINAARRGMGYDLQRVACGAGRNFYGVGPDGSLYPCFRFVGVDAYRLGDVDTGPQAQALERFQAGPGRPYEQRTDCAGCWAAPLCGGPCFAEAELLGPGDGRPFASHCDYMRADAAAATALVQRTRAQDPERLLGLLGELADV